MIPGCHRCNDTGWLTDRTPHAYGSTYAVELTAHACACNPHEIGWEEIEEMRAKEADDDQ